MSNTNGTCNINTRQHQTFHVDVYDKDGNLDTTSPLQASSQTGACTVSIDPTTNRDVTITGNVVGSSSVQILVPSGNSSGSVFVATTVTAAPDIRHMDLTPGPVVGV